MDKSKPTISKFTKNLKVSIIDEGNQEIWAYGFTGGQSFGVSNKSLELAPIVSLLEIALNQAKGELSIANGELLPKE